MEKELIYLGLIMSTLCGEIRCVEIDLKSVECKASEDYCSESICKLEKKDAKDIISLQCKYKKPLEAFKIKIKAVKQEGSIEVPIVNLAEDGCMLLADQESSPILKKAVGFIKEYMVEFPKGCPIDGEMYLKEFPINVKMIPLNVIPLGAYKLNLDFVDGSDKIVFGAEFKSEVK